MALEPMKPNPISPVNQDKAGVSPNITGTPNPDKFPRGGTAGPSLTYVDEQFARTHDMDNPAYANYRVNKTPAPEPGRDALGNLLKTPPPEDKQSIYQRNLSQSQDLINNISGSFNEMLREQSGINEERVKQVNAESAARGLVGSPDAYRAKSDVSAIGQKANQAIETRRAAEIAKILYDVQTRSTAEYQDEQKLYNDAMVNSIAGAETIRAGRMADLTGASNLEAAQVGMEATRANTEAQKIMNTQAQQENFSKLAGVSSVQWDSFQKSNPDLAKKLMNQAGYTSSGEAALRWNAAKIQGQQIKWSEPQQTMNGFIMTGQDPMTGEMKSVTIEAPVSANWELKSTTDGTSIMWNKQTGKYEVFADYIANIPNNMIKLAPTGSDGGQCGDFVHTVVDGVPSMGDSLGEKLSFINKQGVLAAKYDNPKVGDVLIFNTGGNGHAAVINSVMGDGKVQISESNFKGDEKIDNSRVVNLKDKSFYGAYTKGAMKGSVADGTMSPYEMKMRKAVAQLERTEKLSAATGTMMASRKSTIINNTIKSLYGSAASNPVAVYNKSAQVMARVNAAKERALDPSNKAKNVADLDLIDAYVQIARGGQAITEAQVETLLSGMGIPAKFDVATQKISSSATLDDANRKELARLSKAIYDEQGKAAKAALPQLNRALKSAGIPENMLLQDPIDIAGVGEENQLDAAAMKELLGQLQADEILVQDQAGNIGAIPVDEFDPDLYTQLNQ